MRLNTYSIYDSAAKCYQRPFFAGQDGEALRMFGDLANGLNDTPIGQHPEHFHLYRIGTYDDQTATIKNEENESLASAISLVKDKNQKEIPTE
jgi:hypothetical protein